MISPYELLTSKEVILLNNDYYIEKHVIPVLNRVDL